MRERVNIYWHRMTDWHFNPSEMQRSVTGCGILLSAIRRRVLISFMYFRILHSAPFCDMIQHTHRNLISSNFCVLYAWVCVYVCLSVYPFCCKTCVCVCPCLPWIDGKRKRRPLLQEIPVQVAIARMPSTYFKYSHWGVLSRFLKVIDRVVEGVRDGVLLRASGLTFIPRLALHRRLPL